MDIRKDLVVGVGVNNEYASQVGKSPLALFCGGVEVSLNPHSYLATQTVLLVRGSFNEPRAINSGDIHTITEKQGSVNLHTLI